jgi:hypothetical protein
MRILRNETYAGVWHYNKHYGSESQRHGARSKYRRSPKNSSRLRQRAEWLPVMLPEELRIVPRDLWQRVQMQLSKNRVFSPRNARHSYLLKGLVRCGKCGAAYVGDPSHGKYYYRCINRCKQLPTVKESSLDEAVWGAITEAVMNPSIIIDQVSRLRERESEDERIGRCETETVDREAKRVSQEEARLLEAYRTGFISPAQLGQQLEQLKQRQSALEVRSAGLRKRAGAPDGMNLRRTLEEYCRAVAKRMQTFDTAERQRFLRLLIDNVIFEGERVRIRAVIPLGDAANDRSDIRQMPDLVPTRGGVMATTNIHHGGHNSGRNADTDLNICGRNEVGRQYSPDRIFAGESFLDHVNFELCKTLPIKPFSILSDEGLRLVRRVKQERGRSTLRELCNTVLEEKGFEVSVSHMSRALKRLEPTTAQWRPEPAARDELRRAA